MERIGPVKITIPEALKAEAPLTAWGRVLNATPVVMTVVATMLAGLSSSEMTRAQYDRSTATQHQTKAGDQWGFFQAKRLRGATLAGELDLLQNVVEVHPLDGAALLAAVGPVAEKPGVRDAVPLLTAGKLPDSGPAPPVEAKVQAALEAVARAPDEPATAVTLNAVTDATLAGELRAAHERARAYDSATGPVNVAIDQLAAALEARRAELSGLNRDFAAARLRYSVRRYEAESRLNQFIANLYELQVRKSNLSSDRHVHRSQRFFFGMLAAQCGVIISTFAIAARKKSLLWSIAAAAGAGAVSLAVYVYLFL